MGPAESSSEAVGTPPPDFFSNLSHLQTLLTLRRFWPTKRAPVQNTKSQNCKNFNPFPHNHLHLSPHPQYHKSPTKSAFSAPSIGRQLCLLLFLAYSLQLITYSFICKEVYRRTNNIKKVPDNGTRFRPRCLSNWRTRCLDHKVEAGVYPPSAGNLEDPP
jgi:hypothetical protein